MPKNKLRFVPLLLAALVAGAIIVYLIKTKVDEEPAQVTSSQPETEAQPEEPAFNKERFSLDSPDSLWVVVNKKRPLPTDFVSRDLTGIDGSFLQAAAASQANQLVEAAKQDRVQLKFISAYRSYQDQKKVYDSYVRQDGQAMADTYSARPGFSEHQTGLAADLGNADGTCDLEICFETSPGGQWLAANAHKYGFIIRYGKDKTPVTGYQYEPWHIRFVGKELAAEIQKTGQTMEEFFGLPAAPGY